jgi:hypothetical protein
MPLNQFINTDQSQLQRVHCLQETYLQKMNQLTQKLYTIDRQSQGSSLQVMQKENEWKEKVKGIEA